MNERRRRQPRARARRREVGAHQLVAGVAVAGDEDLLGGKKVVIRHHRRDAHPNGVVGRSRVDRDGELHIHEAVPRLRVADDVLALDGELDACA
jgi:hypothetical protein